MHTHTHTHTHTHLFPALLHHKQQVGAVGHSEGEAVLERVGAVVVVADAVLVDVVHAEAAGLPVVLTVARPLDGTVTRSLDDSEDDGLRLDKVMFKAGEMEGEEWMEGGEEIGEDVMATNFSVSSSESVKKKKERCS